MPPVSARARGDRTRYRLTDRRCGQTRGGVPPGRRGGSRLPSMTAARARVTTAASRVGPSPSASQTRCTAGASSGPRLRFGHDWCAGPSRMSSYDAEGSCLDYRTAWVCTFVGPRDDLKEYPEEWRDPREVARYTLPHERHVYVEGLGCRFPGRVLYGAQGDGA